MPTPDNTDTPKPTEPIALTPGEQAVVTSLLRRWLPVAVKWLLSDHDSDGARLLAKAVRACLAAAGCLDAGGAVLSDAGTAKLLDGILIALPAILEVLSHFRDRIQAAIERRWPAPVPSAKPTLPAVGDIKP